MDCVDGDPFLIARQRKRGRDIERHTETRLDLEAERLLLAGIVANDSIARGVSAGDLMWHGGSKSFEIGGVAMDAPALLEYAKARLLKLTDNHET